MYILVRESIPPGFAILAAAHASLAGCVSDEEFERAKEVEDHVVLTESALGGQEVALAFRPREEWPKAFNFYRIYR